MPPMRPPLTEAERGDWAVRGAAGRDKRIITSLFLNEDELEALNRRLQAKLRLIEANERRWEEVQTADAEYLLVAYGTVGRTCKTVVRGSARSRASRWASSGPSRCGPSRQPRLRELAEQVRGILVAEMSAGQMLEDVRLAVGGRCPVAVLRPDGRRHAAAGRNPGGARMVATRTACIEESLDCGAVLGRSSDEVKR